MGLANGLCLIYLPKEPAFSFVEFYYSLLCLFFSYFCSDFYNLFPSANFGLAGDQSWVFIGRTNVEGETPILWPPDVKS